MPMLDSQKSQMGAGLIEVLVAILLLGVGLLGLAGLQTQSLKYNNEAYLRSRATILAQDMADRLRANRDVAITNTSLYTFKLTDTPGSNLTLCDSSNCSPQQLAQYDFAQWRGEISADLPDGKGALEPLAKGSSVDWQDYKITISYTLQQGGQGNGQAVTLTYIARI